MRRKITSPWLSKELRQKYNDCFVPIARTTRPGGLGDATKVSKWTLWCRCAQRKLSPTSYGRHVRNLTAQLRMWAFTPARWLLPGKNWTKSGKTFLNTKPNRDRLEKRKTNTRKILLSKSKIKYSLLCNHSVIVDFPLVRVPSELFKMSLECFLSLLLCYGSVALQIYIFAIRFLFCELKLERFPTKREIDLRLR